MAVSPTKMISNERTEPLATADITKTPEFRAALDDAVGKALASALGPMREQISSAKAGEVVDAGRLDAGELSTTESMLQRLAALIADVNDQGSGRPARVAPEILAKREAARVRMFDALDRMRRALKEAKDDGDRTRERKVTPRYRALTKLWLNEQFIQPFRMDAATRQVVPVEFYWTGPPSQGMLPINPAALEIFGHYRDWIGGIDRSAAKAGYVTPKGIVILVDGNSSPPVTMQQRTGFQPDFGDLDTSAHEDGVRLENDGFEHGLGLSDPYASHGTIDPRKSDVAVLGTVAPPVKHSQPNDVVRRGT